MIEAKAEAAEREGIAHALVIEKKAEAEAKAISVKAEAEKVRGLMEANVLEEKGIAEAKVIEEKANAEALHIEQTATAEAKGIAEKADAMKKLDGVGKEHEEFKLQLEKEKAIELAAIQIQQAIAEVQAEAIAEALKSTNIDIVGGETMFFENIMKAITRGKSLDATISNSQNLTSLKNNLLNGNDGNVLDKVRELLNRFELDSNDIKNLSISALLIKMMMLAQDDETKNTLDDLLNLAKNVGIANTKAEKLGL